MKEGVHAPSFCIKVVTLHDNKTEDLPGRRQDLLA